MSKNILILSGSPRKNGNTDRLVAAFKESAETEGKSVTVFRTADLAIAACLGCNHCRGDNDNGNCVHKDDMGAVLDVFRTADAVVFASPVYWFSVSAQLKLAIDRTYAVPSDKTSIKRCALLLPFADESEDAANGAIVMYGYMLEYREWEDAGMIIVPEVEAKGDIDGREELELARKLGREI